MSEAIVPFPLYAVIVRTGTLFFSPKFFVEISTGFVLVTNKITLGKKKTCDELN